MDVKCKDSVADETVQVALSRAGVYRLFSRLFRSEVDEALLDKLQSPALCERLEYLGFHLSAESNNHKLLQALAEDYMQLFIGPGKHLSPYASVHEKSGEGLLNGRETAAVRRFIKGTGFKFNDSFKDFPDHISAELEYMETLVQHEYDALIADDPVEAEHSRIIQKDLFEDFIDTWIPKYCECVKKNATHSFYQQLADSTGNFLALEREYLSSAMT